ncbi:Spb1 C-terminal domain-containing protein [Lipomyces japonicus]|uniref:Spb1 C-terminal domain-containing protein n=1 Tax=Lipomyces japonicus TaxID=56871 RepID=UPI0034CF7C66
MGKTQKKFGKGRLDQYYRLAKEKGYRARAAFKILQINQKYGNFLEKSKVVIDLCAAPGSWCQVAANLCPPNSLIVGVDLAPIKPISNVISFQEDITSDKCRAQLRQYLKTWKADCVLHDGAPNVGTAWVQDAFTQSELVLQSLKLATEFLMPGGIFVTKVFRSKDYNNLMWVFNQLFNKVEATKPPASRNVSAEIFVVCRGFKAPKKMDPKFLDPRAVFEDLTDPTPNYEAKVYNPEKKKRKRDGYEEGNYTQFKTVSVLEYIKGVDPIASLGSMSQFTWDIPKIEKKQKNDEENENQDEREQPPESEEDLQKQLKIVRKAEETTPELKELCRDLKVLGKKDFRALLKWRSKCRSLIGLDKVEDEEPEEDPDSKLTEEEKIEKELDDLQDKEAASRKRDRRKRNEQRQKEIIRMQMGMVTPMDIGIEAAQVGADSLFSLKDVEKSGQLETLSKGKMNIIVTNEDKKKNEHEEIEVGEDSDADADRLEEEMDNMYEMYQTQRAENDTKYRAKKAREENSDTEWNGFEEPDSDSEGDDDDDDDSLKFDEDYRSEDEPFDDDDDDDEQQQPRVKKNKLLTNLERSDAKVNGLSKDAHKFFSQSVFEGIDGMESDSDDSDNAINKIIQLRNEKQNGQHKDQGGEEDGEKNDKKSSFEIVKAPQKDKKSKWDEDDDNDEDGNGDGSGHGPSIDIITAEAMTLAHQVALKEKSKTDIIDDSYNRYSLRDRDGLPQWFLDDEDRFSKPIRPISAEAAAAIQSKLRALNARPIKKVEEARARKKMKAARKLEKLRKKSDIIVDDPNKSEKDKAESIQKLMRKATKKTAKPEIKVVVARGVNRGILGRPKGVKGRYKMVDGRMKKEMRAIKRKSKK